MVDRVYLRSLPSFQADLEELERAFAQLETATDWNRLRVQPLLRHVRNLEEVLDSDRFAREQARLPRGVAMFHSDLVYLRENLRELKKTLEREARATAERA